MQVTACWNVIWKMTAHFISVLMNSTFRNTEFNLVARFMLATFSAEWSALYKTSQFTD